ncbi:MAG: alpha/beta hydrolase, partial [Gammaproteobacteria bacterium]|nr:alpha/beta hydrolase [Gammaproteobacteria bacterium]
SGCKWADGWHDYLPNPCDASHPYAAPGPSMRLAGLPATLLVSARDDPLRDETHAYARRLRGNGVLVEEAVLPLDTGWPDSYLDPQSNAVYLPAYSMRSMLASKAPVRRRTRSCRMPGKRTSNGSDSPASRNCSIRPLNSIGSPLGP